MPKQRSEWGVGDPTLRVVGDRFCNPHVTEMIVKRKIQKLSNDHYEAFDLSGNLLLQIDGGVWGFQRKRVMLDPAGLPVLTIREKTLALSPKWKVYMGEKSGDGDRPIFTVKQSRAVSLKASLDVYLPENSDKHVCDFRLSGSCTNLSFKVLKSDALLAEVKHRLSWRGLWKGKHSFRVRVNPEVDYAFIIALLVIMNDNDALS